MGGGQGGKVCRMVGRWREGEREVGRERGCIGTEKGRKKGRENGWKGGRWQGFIDGEWRCSSASRQRMIRIRMAL